MPNDSGFDQAEFKKHLDSIYPHQIIDETYPQRPSDVGPALPVPAEAQTPGDSANAVLPQVTITNSRDSEPDYLTQATDTAKSQTDIALDKRALDFAAQKQLLAHPEEIRRLFPEMLKSFNRNGNDGLDMGEIDRGLTQPSLTDLQRNYLTVLKNGYRVLHDKPEHQDDGGIESFDLEKTDRAMHPDLNEDPLYVRDALLAAPKLALGAGFLAFRLSKGGSAKDKAIEGGLVALGALAITEVGYFLAHQFGGYESSYEDVAKKYRAFAKSYDAPPAVASPRTAS